MRRMALPSVMPKPRSSGLGDHGGDAGGLGAELDFELVRL